MENKEIFMIILTIIYIISIIMVVRIYKNEIIKYKILFHKDKAYYEEKLKQIFILKERIKELQLANKTLRSLFKELPVCYSEGGIRKTFQIRASGKVVSRININEGNKMYKRTFHGEVYYSIADYPEYISRKDLLELLELPEANFNSQFEDKIHKVDK